MPRIFAEKPAGQVGGPLHELHPQDGLLARGGGRELAESMMCCDIVCCIMADEHVLNNITRSRKGPNLPLSPGFSCMCPPHSRWPPTPSLLMKVRVKDMS